MFLLIAVHIKWGKCKILPFPHSTPCVVKKVLTRFTMMFGESLLTSLTVVINTVTFIDDCSQFWHVRTLHNKMELLRGDIFLMSLEHFWLNFQFLPIFGLKLSQLESISSIGYHLLQLTMKTPISDCTRQILPLIIFILLVLYVFFIFLQLKRQN